MEGSAPPAAQGPAAATSIAPAGAMANAMPAAAGAAPMQTATASVVSAPGGAPPGAGAGSEAAAGSIAIDDREHDKFLPIANISRIMKRALPANAKIAKDAKETVQECVSEFISFITSEGAPPSPPPPSTSPLLGRSASQRAMWPH